MKIFYFTNAMNKDDFASFMCLWKYAPNPSNQNFHNKVIRSLSLQNEVHVISIRPFDSNNCSLEFLKEEQKVEGNIYWHYLRIETVKSKRRKSIRQQAKKLIEKYSDNQSIIITDTINLSCLMYSCEMKKVFKLKTVGICTDNPNNISFTNSLYKKLVMLFAKKLDGYITLTAPLNSLFNKKNKPTLLVPGIIEESSDSKAKEEEGSYFFFGGAMLERYGVYNLIEAYKKLDNCTKKLIICGHHYDETRVNNAIGDNKNILFLKTLPIDQVIEYEKNAYACINPRPKDIIIDQYSIPSKTLDYLGSGRLTISVENVYISEAFLDSAIWINDGDTDSILFALKKSLSIPPYMYNEMCQKAKEKALQLYSLKTISEKLNNFLILL